MLYGFLRRVNSHHAGETASFPISASARGHVHSVALLIFLGISLRCRPLLRSQSSSLWPFVFCKIIVSSYFDFGTSSLTSWLFISNDRLPFSVAFPQVPKHILAVSSAAAGCGCPRLLTGCKSQEAFSGAFAEAGDLGSVTEGFVVSSSLAAPASLGRGKKLVVFFFFFFTRNNERGKAELWRSRIPAVGSLPSSVAEPRQSSRSFPSHPHRAFSIFFFFLIFGCFRVIVSGLPNYAFFFSAEDMVTQSPLGWSH